MSEVVQVERNGGIATIRMNRPERLNAYNAEMGEALLSRQFSEASADPVGPLHGPHRRRGRRSPPGATWSRSAGSGRRDTGSSWDWPSACTP